MIKSYDQFINENNNPYQQDHNFRKDLCLKDPKETMEQDSNEVYKNGLLLSAMEYFTITYSNGEPEKYCFKNVSDEIIYLSSSKDPSKTFSFVKTAEQLTLVSAY